MTDTVDCIVIGAGVVGLAVARLLADAGARVIKIEQRGSGDPGRYLVGAGGVDTSSTPNWSKLLMPHTAPCTTV